jgi:uncharacterized protein (DUF433 family)
LTGYTADRVGLAMSKAISLDWAKRHIDPRELPSYSIPESAHYIRIPRSTLRAWVAGQAYRSSGVTRSFKPIITLPDRHAPLLSFINLVEAHVLDALRREHEVSLQKVRKAIMYLSQHLGSRHPLAEQRFETDGVDLFIRQYGQLVNISQSGQLAMRKILEAYLRRVEWDEAGVVARLYPFTRKRKLDEPRAIVIDPRVSFGRPVLAGSGIPTAVIAERYKAGESMDELADDYGRKRLEIEEAIRCELDERAA